MLSCNLSIQIINILTAGTTPWLWVREPGEQTDGALMRFSGNKPELALRRRLDSGSGVNEHPESTALQTTPVSGQ